ncbi:unnamed protein product [Anisakis simplex]|uniref:ABC transmembrane type-1 domain-containing protein n=1 Tax=Anisakis simplex TaxID=6269 RepID=A0A0M3JSZ6_ANISI|nr:unnamed protein product [Anisakis simplex]
MSDVNNYNENASDERDVSQEYEQSAFDKLISTLLCRGDFAEQKLEAPPISFLKLFRFASFSDKILITVSIILAVLCGIGQPLVVLIGGRLTNTLLKTKQVNI